MTQAYTDSVKTSFGPNAHARGAKILASLIQHLHDFARENNITTEEYLWGMDFVNRIGHMSDEKRNEAILVSDVLGLESLVDTLTHASETTDHTSLAILGPFYRENAPVYPFGASIIQKDVGGHSAYVFGKITSASGEPLAGAKIEVWHCAPNGLYEQQDPEQPEYNLRGTFFAEQDGTYAFQCLRPTAYPIPFDGPAGDLLQYMDRHPMRPGHIHWRVTHPKYHSLVTQTYDHDDPYTEDDAVFGVKEDIVIRFQPAQDRGDVEYELEYDIALPLEEDIQKYRQRMAAL